MKKVYFVLGAVFLALTGVTVGFMGKRATEASRFGTPVEFNPIVLSAPASQTGALGQAGACNN